MDAVQVSAGKPDPSCFVTTRWTLVHEAAAGGDTRALAALGDLLGTYWQPLYRYARRKGMCIEDAEDVVQSFIGHILESSALRNVHRDRGRFRAFLLASFNHWMINEWKRATREKRGGGVEHRSFDWPSAETGLHLEVADEQSPDRLFDREWTLTLLNQVLANLERACREEGNGAQFDALKPCLTADSSRVPYATIAAQLNMTEGAARVAVHRLRKRYRALLTDQVARTLASPEFVEEELRSLLASLAG
jgi:RNA polymerase sigma-70 factor (ECF subfamily)